MGLLLDLGARTSTMTTINEVMARFAGVVPIHSCSDMRVVGGRNG